MATACAPPMVSQLMKSSLVYSKPRGLSGAALTRRPRFTVKAIQPEKASVQNNALEVGQVNFEKQIYSKDSTQVVCSRDSAQVICSEDLAQVIHKDPCHGNLNKKMDFKSKKHACTGRAGDPPNDVLENAL